MLSVFTPKESNCYSVPMEVCSDSCHSETRLPGFLSHALCAVYADAMKLYFPFCQQFQQIVALFGGCGFGLFERVYLKFFCHSDRHGDRKIAKQFYFND